MANIPTVVLIGRPNVGKSSLFNRLSGRRQAITHETAGTTRDANYAPVEWAGYYFTLVDTAGLSRPGSTIEEQSQSQVEAAIASADVVVQVIDATSMLTSEDLTAAKLAHRSKKPYVAAINKIDAAKDADLDQYRKLGTSTLVTVSAIQGRSTGDLLDEICAHIRKLPAAPAEDNVLRIAFLGRPNVGKSSLFNNLVGKQSAVVSDTPGTTRDIGSTMVRYHDRDIELLDTAGLRRPGKVERGIEEFSVLRTLTSIRLADICVLLIDANEPTVAMDQHVAGLAAEAGKGLIIVVNKWDTVEKDDKTQARLTRRLQNEYQFVWWAPLVYTSALTGLNTTKIFELATQIDQNRHTTIATGPLNRLIGDMVEKQPPSALQRRRAKINYATQTGTNPPTFALFGAGVEKLHFSYKRYLENGLRTAYDFSGTPIHFELRAKPEHTK